MYLCFLGENQWKLFGVTSWGVKCGENGHPGIYAKLSSYTAWIHNIFQPSVTSNCMNGFCNGNRCTTQYGRPIQEEVSCGIPSVEPRLNRPPNSLIINGIEVRPHSWSWQLALLEYGHTVASRYSHTCGGSLIGHEWALTAAHCRPRKRMRLVVGLDDYTNCTRPHCQVVTITNVWIHPHYTDSNSSTPLHNDVALVRFFPPIDFGETMSPICLPEPCEHPPDGTKCYATGWGHTDPYRWSIPEILQQVELPLIPDDQCKIHYPAAEHWAFVSSKMICAGDLESGGPDSCVGDSGGPLVCKLPGQ